MMKKIVFFLILTSCAVGPDYVPEMTFDDYSIQKTIGLNEDNKDFNNFSPYDFNDEILNTFMDEVQEKSPTIQVALLRLKQARENLRITSKNAFPMFDITGKYNFINESKNMGIVFDSNYYQVGLDMNWEIDIFGKTRRQKEASKAQFLAEIYNLKNINVSLVAEVATNYVNLKNIEQQLEYANENYLIEEGVYNLVNDQYKVDLADEISLSQAKYLMETTKMSIPKLEFEREKYIASLALLLGRLPNEIVEYLNENGGENLVNKTFNYDIEKLYDIPVTVIRNRPDVKIAEENLIAQNANIGVAVSEFYPSISLAGFFGLQSLKWSNLAESNSKSHSFVPVVSLPLFHWGQLNSNVKIQELMKEEKFIEYKNTILLAINEIKSSIVGVIDEYKINKSAKSAYENIQKATELTWKKYKLGLVGYNDVLNAEQRRITAQTNMVNSNANLYKSLITFYKSIGGKPWIINRDK